MSIIQKLDTIYKEFELDTYSKKDLYYKLYNVDFFDDVFTEVENFDYQVFDGRLEDAVLEIVYESIKNNQRIKNKEAFNKFLNDEIKKIAVPVLILLPLVILGNTDFKHVINYANEDISIFPVLNSRKLRKQFNQFIINTIGAKINDYHIEKVKDGNFFKYPIMVIRIESIDTQVERESSKIVEVIYSLIRMIGFGIYKRKHFDSILKMDEIPNTYGVFYNIYDDYLSINNKGCYGYNYRYMFSPLLDINYELFDEYEDLLTKNINRLIETTFKSKESTIKSKKWKNAVLLFNEAYELASREKFDSSLILLFSLLESLFLKKGIKIKGENLALVIPEFLNISEDDEKLKNIIKRLYKIRNDFIHEAKRIHHYKIYKTVNDLKGTYTGAEPFTFINNIEKDHELNDLYSLFEITCYILLNYS